MSSRSTRPNRLGLGRRAALAASLALGLSAAVASTGCLASGSSRSTSSGRFIGDDTVSKIEPGVTTREWIRAVLGEPSSAATLSDGRTEVWKWEFSETKASRGAVFLLFRSSTNRTTQRTVYVEFEEGVVRRAWSD